MLGKNEISRKTWFTLVFGWEEDNAEEFDIKEILENKDLMTMMIDELREVAPGAGLY